MNGDAEAGPVNDDADVISPDYLDISNKQSGYFDWSILCDKPSVRVIQVLSPKNILTYAAYLKAIICAVLKASIFYGKPSQTSC